MKHSLDDVSVRARQHLPEDGAGDLNVHGVPFGPVQPRRLEPRRKGVDADPGLHVFEKFVPGIRHFALTPKLRCSRHRNKKTLLCYFHRCEKTVESRSTNAVLQASGFLPAPERLSYPCRSGSGLSGFVGPRTAAMSTRGIVSD